MIIAANLRTGNEPAWHTDPVRVEREEQQWDALFSKIHEIPATIRGNPIRDLRNGAIGGYYRG